MTLEEMRKAVYRRLGDTAYLTGGSDPSLASPDEVRNELNLSAERIVLDIFAQGVTLIEKLVDFTVTSGTQEYPLSDADEAVNGGTSVVTDDDFLALILIEKLVTPATPSTFVNCEFIDGGDVRRKNDARTVHSSTTKLYLRGQRLGFVDAPDNSTDQYRIHYAPRPVTLVEATATTDLLQQSIPREYHELVVQGAVVELYAAEESSQAERSRLTYQNGMERLMRTVGSRFRQQPIFRRGRRPTA